MSTRTMVVAIIASLFATHVPATVLAEDVLDRPCIAADLVGAWILDSGKNQGAKVPDALSGLMLPVQVRVYGESNDYRELTASNSLTSEQIQDLLSVSQDQSYELRGDLVLTRRTSDGVVLDGYQCRLFVKPLASANIMPGTLSLMWFHDETPVVLNTYVRYELGAPLVKVQPNQPPAK